MPFASFESADSPAHSQTTRFQVKTDGTSWWFVDPKGNAFRSLGVCCTNQGVAPDKWSAINPGYSALKLYPNVEAWSKATQDRLSEWGFNTVGSWSEHETLRGRLYQTPVLHLVSYGIPWRDMWDPKILADTNKFAADQIAKWRDDPNVIGYFSDNELGWWYGAMFEWAWRATPKYGTRKRLVDLLKRHYVSNWPKVLKDFDPDKANSFASLEKSGRLFLRPGGNGMAYVRAVMRMLAARYYIVCRESIKKADPKALFLGDRYISNFYPEVAEEAGKVVDALSTNLNACWADGSYYRFYLDDLYKRARKPILITEFYQCAMENRSGNMNDASGFPTVRTQLQRARSLDHQLRQLFEMPYVVGAHWFQFYDEPMHGRDDGENYNMGLVDIWGRPYEESLRVFRGGRYADPKSTPRPEKRLVAKQGVPQIEPLHARDLENWPRDLAYVPHEPGDARGDLYVAWHRSGLFIGLAWDEDRFSEAFYRDGKIPAVDRAKLSIKFAGVKDPIQAVIGIGGEMELTGAVFTAHHPGTRNTAIFRVPTNSFGKPTFSDGDKISMSANFTTRGRAYRMTWKGEFVLRGTRD